MLNTGFFNCILMHLKIGTSAVRCDVVRKSFTLGEYKMCEWIFLRLAAYRTPDVLGLASWNVFYITAAEISWISCFSVKDWDFCFCFAWFFARSGDFCCFVWGFLKVFLLFAFQDTLLDFKLHYFPLCKTAEVDMFIDSPYVHVCAVIFN